MRKRKAGVQAHNGTCSPRAARAALEACELPGIMQEAGDAVDLMIDAAPPPH
jgi:hypothetical protein